MSKGKKPADDDEVEQLLRAAQDDMLLKLSVNSHTTRTSAAIDPDLDRRFEALKKPQKPAKSDTTAKIAGKSADSGGSKVAGKAAEAPEGDDLFTRFAALKGSNPSHSGKENGSQLMMEEDDDDEDEVEKVIKWAIDAARLDPSPLSDDDDDHHNEDSGDEKDDDNDDDTSEDDNRVEREKKGKRK